MKFLRCVALLTLLTTITAWSQDSSGMRVWTGVNGKTFRGALQSVSPDKTQVVISSAVDDSKLITVAIANLIAADQEFALNAGEKSEAVKPSLADFKPPATPDRSAFPDFLPTQLGCPNNAQSINLVWQALLWWNKIGFIESEKKGDLDKIAPKIYKEISRNFSDNPNPDMLGNEMEKYFQTALKDIGNCRVKSDFKVFRGPEIARCASGPNLVILKMTMDYKNRQRFSQPAVLSSMSDDGKFTIHMYGKRFTGHLREIPQKEREEMRYDAYVKDRNSCELVIENLADLPDYYRPQEPRYYLGISAWDGMTLVKPYIYQTHGKPVPLPADPEWTAMTKN